MEATSCAALRLCQELSAALELQNVEFQRYVDAIRRQTGPFLEQTAFIEAFESPSLLEVEFRSSKASNASEDKRNRSWVKSGFNSKGPSPTCKMQNRGQTLSAKLTHSEMEQNQDPGALEDHQERGDSSAEAAVEQVSEAYEQPGDFVQLLDSWKCDEGCPQAEAPIDQRDPASPLRQDQLIEEKRNRAQQRKQRRMEEAALPQGRAAAAFSASAIISLSEGWDFAVAAETHAPPAGPQKLIWSKDIGRRVFGRRLTSLDLKE
ncbi:unnamed protein product, partial [Symbiodinium necroappetens]